jgi:hypothetical protein
MINQKLNELYKEHYAALQEKLEGICAEQGDKLQYANFSAPLLINFVDENKVEDADFRIMLFGQETRGWNKGSFEEIIGNNKNFYNDFAEYNPLPEHQCWQKQVSNFSFWSAMQKMRDEIQKAQSDKKISFIWNNISKIDYNGRKLPANATQAIVPFNRDLILGEIAIIKPNMLVFFTGSTVESDKKIESVFNDGNPLIFTEIDVNGNRKIFASINVPGRKEDSFVSCHPSYSQFVETENQKFILGKIVDEVNRLI